MRPPTAELRSICAIPTDQGNLTIASPGDVEPSTRQHLRNALHTSMVKVCPANTWAGSCHLSSCPYPVLVNNKHQAEIEKLNEIVVKVLDDIVPRWWKDTAAKFPERMPLLPYEEKLLRWLDTLGTDMLRPFKECRGSWRPDFLVEKHTDQGREGEEFFRICEINARFTWNGFMMSALGQQALSDMGVYREGICSGTDSQKITDGLQNLYNPDLPLFLLRGEEHGYDIHLYTHYARTVLDQRVRMIKADDLRLIPHQGSLGGYKLCCVADPKDLFKTPKINFLVNEEGEHLEEIHQMGLELQQREIHAFDYEMLQQISLRCFNDMRTLLLVHDKRMLGIMLEEVDSLVARQVISPSEAGLLQQGICPTILPGSHQMTQFIEQCRLHPNHKDEYILKAVRDGKGEGIVFGDNMTHESWMDRLEDQRSPHISPRGVTSIVQRKIRQAKYDVLLRENEGVQNFPLIGTYHVVKGQFLGLGVWRSSPDAVCAISYGGAWMCSVKQTDP
ncbi:hypothetical protein N7457_006391 [Penicillium paradoxum]|uniref:uncharacterized protein n=1 Tax=Penicillium paradoxum TaxID=176176 RepID=UPI0025470E09|nr:uncharacterized protein N7457_006391 [Penicillium paradoxum]KAJ5781231.1 hypothetical protein N7457_006391 [Penicillium paradoxum]